MIRIAAEKEAELIPETTLEQEGYSEDDLREWILSEPTGLLNEEVMIIGREVTVSGFRDRIDLLGIDPEGNVVIIELKRGAMKGSDDFQGLKYAAYASQWGYDDLREQFNKFIDTRWGESLYGEDAEFSEELAEFCNEDYAVNKDQRIMFVGESIRARLKIVTRWLSERDIDVSITKVTVLKSDGDLYLDSEQKVPVPESESQEVRPDTSKQPWKKDGRAWHIDEITDEPIKELLKKIITAIGDIDSLSGPEWKKNYIAFKQGRRRRVVVDTNRSRVDVDLLFLNDVELDVQEISDELDVATEQVTMNGGHREGKTGIRITCEPIDTLDVEALAELCERVL